METFAFRAMNTDIRLLAPFGGPLFDRAAALTRATFEHVEASLSRFRPDSELSRLNAGAGHLVRVSPLLWRAVNLALDAARSTGGVFDPTVLRALEAAGYDRSFELVGVARPSIRVPVCAPDYRRVTIDRNRHAIALPAGLGLDLGGIGKGLAVDMAMEATAFLPDRCINAGGDLAVQGHAGSDSAWTVDIEDAGAGTSRTVTLNKGAMATSTITKRVWQQGAAHHHHLIDPRTAEPSASPFRSVSAVAPTCVQADVAAKTVLLMGERGLCFAERHGIHVLAIRHDGSTAVTATWPWR